MTFRPRSAYYLRISTNIILPLFLYLDERHIDWMSDIVLQHLLADLRPLIVPKLQAEKDVHFGPGSAPGIKRGTVEVHRGETYQFAYFFRKTEPHTVLFKSRYFVTAPLRPEVAPRPVSSRSASRRNKPSRARVSTGQSKRKRVESKEKGRGSKYHLDQDEWSAEECEEDTDDPGSAPGEPRPVRKQRRVIADTFQEGDDDAEDMEQNVAMSSPPLEMDAGLCENLDVSIVQDRDVVASGTSHRLPDTADTGLAIEEEETQPKPLLKLKYQSFPITGHCLCVVVEPWPPLRAEPKLSAGPGMPIQLGGSGPSILPPNEVVIAGQRAKTPLFLPEYDGASGEIPFPRAKTLPPAPLFYDTLPGTTHDDDDTDDDLMDFSQALNAAGLMHAIAADDDDMDGAVLFGDADEVRELY